MRNRSTLLGGAAFGVLLALGLSATAGAADTKAAKPTKHHHAAAKAATRDYGAEIEALTARLDAEESARLQSQAQLQAAQADAAAARADAQAARAQVASQIQTIPGVVSTAVAANKPKPSWADNTTVGATVYTDLSNIAQSPTPNSHNGTGVDVKRAYISVDHKFDDVFSANVTVDLAPNGTILNGGTYGTGTGQGSEVVKKAYFQAKVLGDALVVRGGEADMPWIPFVEGVYGYRFVEKTITDFNKIGNSADYGAFAAGSLADGLINYSFAAVDGAGYKNAVRSEGMDYEGRVNLNWNGFVAAVGGYTGKLSKNYQNATPVTFQTADREDALVAFTNKQIRIGFEYFAEQNWNAVTSTTPDKGSGYSTFGSFNFTPQIAVFGRYDWEKPSATKLPGEKFDYFNIGLNYEPVKVLDLALVYKHEALTGGTTSGYASDPNTTLTPLVNGGGAHFDEVGLFGQFKF